MPSGLSWKKNEGEVLERYRKFYTRKMQDRILAILPVDIDVTDKWKAFDEKWNKHTEGEDRPFPSNEEIYDRIVVWLKERSQVEDDWLPVVYSALDVGESMVGAIFGQPIRFIHRHHGPAVTFAKPIFEKGYENIGRVKYSEDSFWTKRILEIQKYFEDHAEGNFAQHGFLTMDAFNFAVEMRGATRTYLDVYEYPDELKQLLEIGLDFNIRFQEAQSKAIPEYKDGCFVWIAGWAPFDRAISMSVDGYTMCSVDTYLKFGFEYNRRLIEHFGHGMMHFHCNRPDLAKEVAKLPGLELFQYGAGVPNQPEDYSVLPEMREAVGDIPIQVSYPLKLFMEHLEKKKLKTNVMYTVYDGTLTVDEANRLADTVREYKT